jgi:hypothetical protein
MTHWTIRYLGRVDNYSYADVCPSDCKLAMVVAARWRVCPSSRAMPQCSEMWGFASVDQTLNRHT